ncbi:MAG: hypothetical protein HQK49_18420 [Oligoflexia bacterium]|nr:hypothetical protein [Oligoflexia bacterium]
MNTSNDLVVLKSDELLAVSGGQAQVESIELKKVRPTRPIAGIPSISIKPVKPSRPIGGVPPMRPVKPSRPTTGIVAHTTNN